MTLIELILVMGLMLILMAVISPRLGGFSTARSLSSRADCLLMLSDPVIYSPQTAPQLILQLLQHRMPIFASSPAFVKAGALAGLQADPEENGRAAAAIVDRILKGEKASSIPYVWPSQFIVSLNMVVADRLNVPVPASLQSSAEQVVK